MVLLLLVVYSILGMALFGTHAPVLPPTAAASPATAVDFRTFGRAMLTMFKLFTLDGWSGALQQLLRCDGVVYLYGGTAAFAEQCHFTPVRAFGARRIFGAAQALTTCAFMCRRPRSS